LTTEELRKKAEELEKADKQSFTCPRVTMSFLVSFDDHS